MFRWRRESAYRWTFPGSGRDPVAKVRRRPPSGRSASSRRSCRKKSFISGTVRVYHVVRTEGPMRIESWALIIPALFAAAAPAQTLSAGFQFPATVKPGDELAVTGTGLGAI